VKVSTMTGLGAAADAGRSTRQRWSVRGLAVLASAAIACVGLAAPGGAAAATHGGAATPHLAKVGTHYAITKRLCTATPKPGRAACDAMRLVRVSKGTPGARPYVVKNSYPVGLAGGYTPADFATAYGFNPAGGAGQTIGIVDAYDDPTILTDLGTFDTQYLLPAETATSFVKVGQTGLATSLPTPDTTGWSSEEALDVETARGVCHTCKIILVEVNSPSDINLAAGVKAAVRLGATEVSNSYGGPEDPNWSKAVRASYEKSYSYPGVVVTASTGDDGWFSWDRMNDGGVSAEAPNTPSTLPTVVAVGGTRLGLSTTGKRANETVWNENGFSDSAAIAAEHSWGASGGGCSVLYNAAGWQAHVPGYTKTGCGKKRLAADVSADADPDTGFDIITSYNCGTPCAGFGSWETFGGTSLSSPLIAAMWALAGGSGGVAYPAMSLYGHAVSASPPRFDVKLGGNSWCDQDPSCAAHTGSEAGGERNPNDLEPSGGGVPFGTLDCSFIRHSASATRVADDHQCFAAKGYDGPSGVGSPNGLTLFKPMSPHAKIHAPSKINAKSKAKFIGGGRDPFPGGTIAKYAWKWGDGHKSTSKSPSHAHVYQQKGQYTVTLTEEDVYGRFATTTATISVHKAKAHHKKKK
jgi:PKD domain